MNSAAQIGFLLDYIKTAARLGADLPDLDLELHPNGEFVLLEGYASEEEANARSEAFHSANPDFDYSDDEASMPTSSPRPAHKRKRRPDPIAMAKRAMASGLNVKSVSATADGVIMTFNDEVPVITDELVIETADELRKLI